jgi:hypothetical protein
VPSHGAEVQFKKSITSIFQSFVIVTGNSPDLAELRSAGRVGHPPLRVLRKNKGRLGGGLFQQTKFYDVTPAPAWGVAAAAVAAAASFRMRW